MKLVPFLICSGLIAWMFSCTSNEPPSANSRSSMLPVRKSKAMDLSGKTVDGDSVRVFVSYVKADRKKQFESFVHEIFYNPNTTLSASERRIFSETKVIHPAFAQPDGSLVYMFMMAPLVTGAEFEVPGLLKKIFGKEKGSEYEKIFNDCLAKEQLAFSGIQSK